MTFTSETKENEDQPLVVWLNDSNSNKFTKERTVSSSSYASDDEENVGSIHNKNQTFQNKKQLPIAEEKYDRRGSNKSHPHWKYACILSAITYVITFSFIPFRKASSSPSPMLSTDDAQAYTRPNILFGHLHMAKTGGTTLNGIMANRFERVCGNKGYSYDAYLANERAKEAILAANDESIKLSSKFGHDRVKKSTIYEIGFEDCDYISTEEENPQWWIDNFGDGRFHNGTVMELHVPCRDPIDHLMSQCNYFHHAIDCDAENDEDFYKSIEKCYVYLGRYSHRLRHHFDVKCFDFHQEFTTYVDLMAKELQERRFVAEPYIKRETNRPRNKASECIWGRQDLIEKAREYLIENVEYYQFCDECIGSEDDLIIASN